MPRKGYAKRADIPADLLTALQQGTVATATLVEGLAIDFTILLKTVAPEIPASAIAAMPTSITQRMQFCGALLKENFSLEYNQRYFAQHPSDTVRGWYCYAIATQPLNLTEKIALLRPLAADEHFAVREWAWLSIRPAIVAETFTALKILQPFVNEESAYLRRFACEATRPRGVWCAHIPLLKQNPQHALELIQPLFTEQERYVQDSIANWLNDAGKDNPDWVQHLLKENPIISAYIKKRAARNLG